MIWQGTPKHNHADNCYQEKQAENIEQEPKGLCREIFRWGLEPLVHKNTP